MNVKIEKGLIGVLLGDLDFEKDKLRNVKSFMFSDDMCKASFEYIVDDKIQDVQVLASKLAELTFTLECAIDFLSECIRESVKIKSVEQYVETLINEYKADSIAKVVNTSILTSTNIDGYMNNMNETLNKLNGLTTNKDGKSLADIVRESSDKLFRPREKVIKTGFYQLDDTLNGLEGGDVTVIGARPAVGKSAFTTQMIIQMAQYGYNIAYFNLEMNEEQVLKRMLSTISAISLKRIITASSFMDAEEESRYRRALEKLVELGKNISIFSHAFTISEMARQCRLGNAKGAFDLVAIDYLQLVKAERTYGNRASEVGSISKAIKELAMELKIPFIVLSQLNRVSEQNSSKEPTMAELRESGDIEQDASNILLMWNISQRSRDYKGLKVDKNRMGELKNIGMRFYGDRMTFDEVNVDFWQFVRQAQEHDKGIQDLEEHCMNNELDDIDDSPFG